MKLKSFKYFYCLLIFFLYFIPLKGEEKIDIWKSKNKKQVNESIEKNDNEASQELNLKNIKTIELNQKIKIAL